MTYFCSSTSKNAVRGGGNRHHPIYYANYGISDNFRSRRGNSNIPASAFERLPSLAAILSAARTHARTPVLCHSHVRRTASNRTYDYDAIMSDSSVSDHESTPELDLNAIATDREATTEDPTPSTSGTACNALALTTRTSSA